MMTLDDLDDFGGYIAAEANHCDDNMKQKKLDNCWLAPGQQEVLLLIPSLSKTIKNKLAKKRPLSVAEVASMTMAVAEELPGGEAQKQVALLLVAKHLMDRLQEGVMAKAEPSAKKNSERTTPTKEMKKGLPDWRNME